MEEEHKIHIIKDKSSIWCGKHIDEIELAIEWKLAERLISRQIADRHICPMCMFRMGQDYAEKYMIEHAQNYLKETV